MAWIISGPLLAQVLNPINPVITVTITGPSSSPSYDAGSATSINLIATVSGGTSPYQCAWESDRGPTGSAPGVPNFTVPLSAGTNIITLRCSGRSGLGTATITVTQGTSGSYLVNCTTTLASPTAATIASTMSGMIDNGTLCVTGTVSTSGANPFTVSTSKGITLAGQGCMNGQSGYTRLNVTSNGTIFGNASFFAGTYTKLYRFCGFELEDSNSFSGGLGQITFVGVDQARVNFDRLRVDHNRFLNVVPGSWTVFLGQTTTNGYYHGSIDNNFMNGAQQAGIVIELDKSDLTPTYTYVMGTANNMFIENNTLTFTDVGNASNGGCIDAWGWTTFVVRYNTSTNCLWATHTVLHGGGPQNLEFYNNTTNITSSTDPSIIQGYHSLHNQGSGTFILANNTAFAAGGKSTLTYVYGDYRGIPGQGGSLGDCDGTQSIDGNRAPTGTNQGYPCWHQLGRDWNSVFGSQVGNLTPIYAWNNKWTDTTVLNFAVDPSGSLTPAHAQANRDYFNEVTPFNGTTGMGSGLLANRPATCSTGGTQVEDAGRGGVGYYATDVNILYTCTSTNNWTPFWSPYTYPYPWP